MPRKAEIVHIEHIHPLALHKHLAKHFHKHTHQIAHVAQHVHHALMHCGELLLVLFVGLGGILFANFTGSIEGLERTNATEIATYLAQAIAHPENILKKGNLISVWKMDGNVENTFTKGYCTYGAARISPEFFPFTDDTELTQRRTRGGNAVNRCENAEATGYKIGNTPVVGSLVVYDAGGRFGPYGHVGKVMYYSKSLKKIIVRDMAWVSTFTMSDRWDDLTTANVKCYIYNSKTTIPDTPEVPVLIQTGTTQTGTTNTVQTPIVDTHTSAPDTPTTNTPTTPSTPIVVPPPVVVTPPVIVAPPVIVPPVVAETPVVTIPVSDKDILLNFAEVSDSLALHYLGQRDIRAQISSIASMQVGDEAVLTISIKDKKSQAAIDGLLPIVFEFIATNDNISVDYSSIKLVHNGEITVHIKAMQAGTASLIINFGEVKVGKIGLSIQ